MPQLIRYLARGYFTPRHGRRSVPALIACVLAIAGPAAFANASDQMTARVLVTAQS